MEEVKSYVNKDLYGRTYEEFCNSLDVGINLQEEPIEGKIEWALMLLDSKMEKIRQSESDLVDVNLKIFDGCNLFVDRISNDIDSNRLSFLKPYESGLNLKLFNNQFNSKVLSFNDYVSLSRHRQLSVEEKRNISCRAFDEIIRRDFAYYSNNEKWYSSSELFKAISIFEVPCGKIRDIVDNILDESKINRGSSVCIDGNTYTWEGFISRFDKNFLIPIANNKNFFLTKKTIEDFFQDSSYIDDYVNPFKFAMTTELTYFYEWHIYMKENEKSLGFKVPVSPNAFNDVLMFKNLERSGDSRKKAIIHFVKQHYRSNSKSTEEEKQILINRYLRGETKFKWNGLEVHLIPSKHDIQKTKSKKKFIEV